MRVLIMGGTGAIGVSLIEILSAQECDIYVTSRKTCKSKLANVHFLQGNAQDNDFLENILCDQFDTIVDFMVYSETEFRHRVERLLSSTKQYFFLSSSRVYADDKNKITEASPRLLDVSIDQEYMSTDEYALSKARQENILLDSGHSNWTVIRPYITYNEERLQLGIYEKEHWLYRSLQGRTIVFPKDIASRETSLTYGYDVSKVLADLIGKKSALGQMIHIVAPQVMTWGDVLEMYLTTIEEKTNMKPKVYYPTDSSGISAVLSCKYQIKYDRLYDRSFDSSKVNQIIGKEVEYISMDVGLKQCLESFLVKEKSFRPITWRFEAYMDRLTKERTPLSEIPTIIDKTKYLIWRYTPYFDFKSKIKN